MHRLCFSDVIELQDVSKKGLFDNESSFASSKLANHIGLDLDASLECLNDYERDCFVANLLEGYTKKEISQKYRVTPQAILKQIKKAKRKIKQFLKEGYETP